MEPINVIIIYYSNEKLPKRLHFLEAGVIRTIKKIKNKKRERFEVSSSKTEDLRSAPTQRIHLLQHMFQMTAVVPQTPDFYL